MAYQVNEIRFPSSDGTHTVFANVYEPTAHEPVAVVQVSHGMIDYVDRYEGFADYLTAHGIVLAGNNHLGHGKTSGTDEDLGFFAEEGGVDFVLADLHQMNLEIRKRFPGLPIVLFGHSMGSFLARLFVTTYKEDVCSVIIHGTGGSNKALGFGKLLGRTIRLFSGSRRRSKLLANLAFAGYNSHYPDEGERAWLTRDQESLRPYENDKYANFIFTVSAYLDLFDMVGRCNSDEWYQDYPKELPTLIISGDDDPVGAYGKGPREVFDRLEKAGAKAVGLKLYEGARHELFNETNREEVFAELLSFIERTI